MPALRPALLTAIVAACLGFGAVFVVAAVGGGTSIIAAARIWLVTHGSGISIGATDVTLVPLGGTLAAVLLTAAVARWVAAHPIDEPALFAAACGGFLGLGAGILSSVVSVGDVQTSMLRAAAGGFVVGLAGAGVGYSWRHGVPRAWLFADRPQVRAAVAVARSILTTIGAASLMVVLLLLVIHVRRAGDLWAALDPGLGGGLALFLANVLAVPTLVAWAAAVLVGPGIQLGTDSTVDLTGVHVGELPALPVLAVLPGPGEFPSWVFVLALVPMAAALFAGVRLTQARADDSLRDQALLAAGGGVLAGIVLAVVTGVSGGSIGPGRMAEVGSPFLSVLLVAVPTLAAGAALGAVAAHYRVRRAEANRRPGLRSRHKPPSAD